MGHPKTCRLCGGTGWKTGEERKSKANGDDVIYTSLQECDHPWWNDDPDLDEYGYSRTRVPTHAEGQAIARAEYELECRRQGREPGGIPWLIEVEPDRWQIRDRD